MWNALQFDDLKLVLEKEELEKLTALQPDDQEIIENTLDIVADTFRGSLKAKGFKLSTATHSIPSAYKLPALILSRRQIWTRFPNSQSIALDEIRQKEIEWAEKVLANCNFDIDTIPWDDDPENPDNPDYEANNLQGSIKVPYLRYPQFPYGNEFNETINKKD